VSRQARQLAVVVGVQQLLVPLSTRSSTFASILSPPVACGDVSTAPSSIRTSRKRRRAWWRRLITVPFGMLKLSAISV
jgi:hypothetical protein